jgi:hypothetical protein
LAATLGPTPSDAWQHMKVRFVIEQQHNLATFGYRLMGAQFLPLLSVALIRAAHAQH